jgi:hypothetical protein
MTTTIDYVALDDDGDVRTVLDTIAFPGGGGDPIYETGRAEAAVETMVHRTGSLEAAVAELADWSNGKVATRQRPPGTTGGPVR